MPKGFYLATFESTHNALSFYRKATEQGLNAAIMPVPRQLNNSCGLAIRFELENLKEFTDIAKSDISLVENFYFVERMGNERVIKRHDIEY